MPTLKNIQNKWQAILEKELTNEMSKAPAVVPTHDIKHIQRVWSYVQQIAQNIKVDWEVLIVATFLHDIGRHYLEGVREHGPVSAPYAKKVLFKIHFPQKKIDNVLIAISYHDETAPASKRSTIESKVLYDADKLDAFGATGVSRYLIFNAMRDKTLKETIDYALQNLTLRFEQLVLEQTKKIAKERYEYALNYFKKLEREIE